VRRSIFGYLEGDSSGRGLRLSRDLAKHEAWSEAILPADAEAQVVEGETNRRPLIIFAGLACLLLAALVFRLFLLTVVEGNRNLAIAEGNRTQLRVARAPRGVIYDRNKTPLAENVASYDVTVVPQLLPKDAGQRQAIYGRVGALIGLSADQVKTQAETKCKGQDPVKTGCLIDPVPELIASGITREQALLVDQDSTSLPGFALDVNPIRQYSDGGLLSAFLGYTSRVNAEEADADPTYGPTDLIGKIGLEKQYESALRGKNGGEETEVDATGKPIKVLASVNPVPGHDIMLSIDKPLQQKLAESIQKQMDASGAKRASGVIMNPKTGQVLAAVSLPSYDNNLFSRGISQNDYQNLLKDPGQPLFNKVASGAYPSGSIIKPFGAAAALQEGIVNVATAVLDSGIITIPNKYDPAHPSTYKGWERTNGLGMVTVLTALARSSDIFFYKVMGGLEGTNEDFLHPLGVTKLTDYYKKFGLGAKTGIDLPSEAAGRVPTPAWKKAFSGQGWFSGDTYNISVGQGDMLVSPLQMVTAVSAIANGGTVYKPHLVDRIMDASGKAIQQIMPEIVRQGFISPQNLATVRQGMWMAVNSDNGTACCKVRAEVPVQVAGKTGTAETVVHDSGVDAASQSKPHAWFEGFAPYNDPQIAIVVLVEHSGEGAEYAVPAARETLAWYFTQGAGAKH
jgi:penicillin-binding protein 2